MKRLSLTCSVCVRAELATVEPRLGQRTSDDASATASQNLGFSSVVSATCLTFTSILSTLKPPRVFSSPTRFLHFKQQMKYVQSGVLSDPPGMSMYIATRRLGTGLQLYRCLRSTSQLEGYHLHLSRAVNPGARNAGVVYHNERSLWFNHRWNVRARVAAGLCPDIGHSRLWITDCLYHILRGNSATVSDDPKLPVLLRQWGNWVVDCELTPTIPHGGDLADVTPSGANGPNGIRVDLLIDPDNRRLLLDGDDCVRALVAEDIDRVYTLTGLVTTKEQLRAFCKEELNCGRARAVMSGENHAELASRLNQKVPAMDSSVLEATPAAGITEDSQVRKRRLSRVRSQRRRDNAKAAKAQPKSKAGPRQRVKSERPSGTLAGETPLVHPPFSKPNRKRKAVKGPDETDQDMLSGLLKRSQRPRVSTSDDDTVEIIEGGDVAPPINGNSRMPRGYVESVDKSKTVIGGFWTPLDHRTEPLIPQLSDEQILVVDVHDEEITDMVHEEDRIAKIPREAKSVCKIPPNTVITINDDIDEIVGDEDGLADVTREAKTVCTISPRHLLTARSFWSLTGTEWADDSAINAFMYLLENRSLPDVEEPKLNVHAMSTHWYGKLARNGYDDVNGWTRESRCRHTDHQGRRSVFGADIIVIPIHLPCHWTCGIIDLNRKTVEYYDSCRGTNSDFYKNVFGWLSREAKRLGIPFDKDEWTSVHGTRCPLLQKNGHDGIFVVWFAYVRSLDASFTLTSPGSTIVVTVSSKSRRQVVRVEDTAWAFAQHDMPHIRTYIRHAVAVSAMP
eukprot:m.390282 g.390282  ORF g.390282 m.390282 type:complete len:791 (+) comp28299_c0_seq4:6699-9071(+)